MHSARPKPAISPLSWQWALPALAMLLIQIVLYGWMAPRGFEFTDEAYYFHNYLHWRDFTGTVTFFGAYFEWPFRALGMNIAAMRLLSMVMVLTSGAVLMQQVLRFYSREQTCANKRDLGIVHTWCYLIPPMASAMLYFTYFGTLRAPSYNLLSLFTITICTACLLRTLEQQAAGRSLKGAPLLYGLALGACFLSKALTSLLMVLGHLLFFFSVSHTRQWKRLLEIVLLVSAGFAVNILIITLEFPGWVDSLREGLVILGIRSDYTFSQMVRSLRWDIQNALERTGLWLILISLLFFVVRRKLTVATPAIISWVAFAFVAAGVFAISHEQHTRLWLVGMIVAALGLWNLERLGRSLRPMTSDDRADLALMTLLFYLPVAFSFGSNMSAFGHSIMASLFACCAVYLRLYRLAYQGKLTRTALGACTALLCLPALLTQLWALTDAKYTYRQLRPLAEHNMPITISAPATALWVDSLTRKSLNDISDLAKQAGFKPGTDILDLTGDGPGFIYAVGATPLATPWMLGGYAGSDAAAAHTIDTLSPSTLHGTWLLTSTNNPLRVMDWQEMLAKKTCAGSHELAGSVEIANPYAWTKDAPKIVNLQLWKPTNSTCRH